MDTMSTTPSPAPTPASLTPLPGGEAAEPGLSEASGCEILRTDSDSAPFCHGNSRGGLNRGLGTTAATAAADDAAAAAAAAADAADAASFADASVV